MTPLFWGIGFNNSWASPEEEKLVKIALFAGLSTAEYAPAFTPRGALRTSDFGDTGADASAR